MFYAWLDDVLIAYEVAVMADNRKCGKRLHVILKYMKGKRIISGLLFFNQMLIGQNSPKQEYVG